VNSGNPSGLRETREGAGGLVPRHARRNTPPRYAAIDKEVPRPPGPWPLGRSRAAREALDLYVGCAENPGRPFNDRTVDHLSVHLRCSPFAAHHGLGPADFLVGWCEGVVDDFDLGWVNAELTAETKVFGKPGSVGDPSGIPYLYAG
jgi:hypothetical protein